jgi:hypothetical protein
VSTLRRAIAALAEAGEILASEDDATPDIARSA